LTTEMKTSMRIDFDYLEELYAEEPVVQHIRKTKIVDDPGEIKKVKKVKKNYNTARLFKYEGYDGN
jgi:hypothetical protein